MMLLFLLSLTPFAVFTLIGQAVSVELGAVAAAVLALALVLSDWLRPGGSIKILEAGSAALFSAIALYVLAARAPESLTPIRMIANGGLFALALLSMVLRKPFSLQYARETASRRAIESPEFLSGNYVITVAWAVVFGVMFAANLGAIHAGAPSWLERTVVYAALLAGCAFTFWYVKKLRARKAGASAGRRR